MVVTADSINYEIWLNLKQPLLASGGRYTELLFMRWSAGLLAHQICYQLFYHFYQFRSVLPQLEVLVGYRRIH